MTEYNFYKHVASDGGVDKLFLTSQGLATEVNLDKIAKFTEENHMLSRETQDGLLSVH